MPVAGTGVRKRVCKAPVPPDMMFTSRITITEQSVVVQEPILIRDTQPTLLEGQNHYEFTFSSK